MCVCVVSLVVRRGQKTVRTGHQRTAPWTSSIRNWYKQCKVTSNVWSGVQGVHVCLMMQKARTRSLIAVDAFRLELAAVAVFVSVNHHMHCTVFCGFVLTAGKTHARTHARTAPHGSPHIPATRFTATTPGMIFRILNSVFF